MEVFLVSGKARHGKDTVAEIMRDVIQREGKTCVIIHYADLLKHLCKSYFGWNGEKNEVGRTILQHVGTDIVRAKNPNYWVEFVSGVLKMFEDDWDYAIIPDCRFPNEIEYMKDMWEKATSVRVERPVVDSGLTAEQLSHPSETSLDNYPFDHIIWNIGTMKYLTMTVEHFIMKKMYGENYSDRSWELDEECES